MDGVDAGLAHYYTVRTNGYEYHNKWDWVTDFVRITSGDSGLIDKVTEERIYNDYWGFDDIENFDKTRDSRTVAEAYEDTALLNPPVVPVGPVVPEALPGEGRDLYDMVYDSQDWLIHYKFDAETTH